MKLATYFTTDTIHQNGEFQDLGYAEHKGNQILTFCDNINYLKVALENSEISSVIITNNMLPYLNNTNKGIAISNNPRKFFFDIYNKMRDEELFNIKNGYGRCNSSKISTSAIVSKKSYIGDNTIISENVVIKDNVFIGDNCFIDVGVIIGNEGVLHTYDEDENIAFIKHAGVVEIGDNVTLLANSVIVKSVFPNMPTRVSDFSIIGIATAIGHEANISKNCKILGNCVVAKNVKIMDNTIVGSSSVIRENLTLGANVNVMAGSIVVKDVIENQSVSGNFAINHSQNVKNHFKLIRS